MSIIDKVFASIGLGGVKIDAQLKNHIFTVGENIEGNIYIKGGATAQSIDSIYLALHTNLKEINNGDCIYRFHISKPLWIKAHSKKSIPFSFTLPLNTPLSYGGTKIWISTDADIKMAVNPKDKDYIRVYPEQRVATVINEIADLGFRLENTVCYRMEKDSLQVLEFTPFEGSFLNQMEELEMIFHYETKDRVKIYLSVDRKKRNEPSAISNLMDLADYFYQFEIPKSALPSIKEKIKLAISSQIE